MQILSLFKISSKEAKVQIMLALIFFTLSIILFTFGAILTGYNSPIKLNNPQPTYWYQQYWEEVIDKLGPIKAYTKLKEKFSNADYLPTHQALHAFGFAIYKKFGPEGIKYCDDYQRYGCFHGVIASFISERGVKAISEIEPLCPRDQPDSENKCNHGIGHGLVDYLGKSDLNKALGYCKKIGSMSYSGCPQGAIMEYFAPISRKTATRTVESFSESTLFGPCSLLKSEYQKYCYYFVPAFYWPVSVITDPMRAENYCLTVNDLFNQQMCIVSIGVRLSNISNFDLIGSQYSCLKMKARQSQIFCSAGVKWNSGPSKHNILIAKNLCLQFGEKADLECEIITKRLDN